MSLRDPTVDQSEVTSPVDQSFRRFPPASSPAVAVSRLTVRNLGFRPIPPSLSGGREEISTRVEKGRTTPLDEEVSTIFRKHELPTELPCSSTVSSLSSTAFSTSPHAVPNPLWRRLTLAEHAIRHYVPGYTRSVPIPRRHA